jgi:fructuronate reductase
MKRLSLETLPRIAHAALPRYNLAHAKVGIVHLGIGAFHRAHQAVYIDDRLAAGETGWAICGASLRSPDTALALRPQDGLYTVAVRSSEGDSLRVIGAVRELLVAPENPEALIRRMCNPAVRIVSLTVTEKGYCHDPATGTLNASHPDIVADLAFPSEPRSTPGFLVEALLRRRSLGVPPFTILCCDNLPANGPTVRRIVTAFATLRDPALGRFVEQEVAFPATMVDRIVPATTDQDRERVTARLGVIDAWPVVTEPFSQWVIEDRFPSGRPRLEEAGAELVTDVAPYEAMKLRLLNGSHSVLAYLGYLAGHETIADTIADPPFARFVRDLMKQEISPTLVVPAGADLAAYRESLLRRFANPGLRHRTWQIAMDGSQKLPQRLLGTIRDRLRSGVPIDRLALGVAGWMRYVAGFDEKRQPIDVRDPLAERLGRLTKESGLVAERLAPALLGIREIFPEELAADSRFSGAVTDALDRLIRIGARAAVDRLAPG